MKYFLVIYLFSNDEVLLKQFDSYTECDKEADKVIVEFHDEKNVREVSCLQGNILEEGVISAVK